LLKGVGGSKEDVVTEGVPCVRYGDLYTTHAEVIECARTFLTEDRAAVYTPIKYGDVLFAASGETLEEIGKSAVNLIQGDARCGGDMIVLRPNVPMVPRFFGYAADASPSVSQKTSMGRGTTVKHIYPDELKHLTIAVPPVPEQEAIAGFLDRKTASIDQLIAKKERLIALLAETGQALITHTVTKGLNPSAPLKNSGAEWIGKIPAHWECRRIKFLCRLESGHTPSKSEPAYWMSDECIIPWVSLNDTKALEAGDYIDDTAVKISAVGMQNSSAHLIPAGAVVFNRDGARVGLAAIITRPMAVSQHIIAWVCGPLIRSAFLLHVIYAMQDELVRLTSGATIPTIGMGDVGELTSPLPPVEEQDRVVAHLVRRRSMLSSTIDCVRKQVDRLREYRQALITAAVTGKLDVARRVPKTDEVSASVAETA
jgi:type I restriction enzyme S subunit